MIKNILCNLAHKLWIFLSKSESKAFIDYLNNVQDEQEKILLSLIKKNKDTEYGKKYKFNEITSIKDYQNLAPLTEYSDYEKYIDEIAKGEDNILTSEDVLMFELSSGSTSASKYIPYTSTLKGEFQKTIKTWIYDFYSNNKELYKGKSYWSISPVTKKDLRTSGGIPIGFEDDRQYFGFIEQLLLGLLFAVPSDLKYIEDMDTFRYVTLLFLLKEKKLLLFSIWNPTFLTVLMEFFNNNKENLVKDLLVRKITYPNKKLDPLLEKKLLKKLGKNKKRAQEIFKIINSSGPEEISCFEQIWPELKYISCWDSANAALYIGKLKNYFPKVSIIGKGLLATEAFVSFPLLGHNGYALSYRSHFYEFIEIDEDYKGSKIKSVNELELNKVYSIVLTTGGGFYRYKLNDLVKVVGFIGDCPLIDFVGKQEKVADYFGEKVNEYHVAEILSNIFNDYKISPGFFMVSCEETENSSYSYLLFLETDDRVGDEILEKVLYDFEQGLLKNFHYEYCRKLDQLKHPILYILKNNSGVEAYTRFYRERGMKIGDIKPPVLDVGTGWLSRFEGTFFTGKESKK